MGGTHTNFFYTSEGKVHTLRIAGILYIIGLLPGWTTSQGLDWMRALFTLGWWVGFCRKRQPQTIVELVRDPFSIAGGVLMLLGLLGQFYALRQAAHGGGLF